MQLKELISKARGKVKNKLREIGSGESSSEEIKDSSSDDLTQKDTENSEEIAELEEAKTRYASFDREHIWAFIAGHSSQDFRGNPKYLFVYINRYRSDIATYWLCSDEDTIAQIRELGFTVHKLETPAAQYAIDHTGVLVEEQVKASLPEGFEDVKYLNLWHGVGAKHIERKYYAKGRELGPARKYIRYNAFYRDHQILTVTSPTIEQEFIEDCGVDEDKLLRTGYLRCEYQQNFEPIHSFDSNLRELKGLSEETALAVYAPTYRATGEARFNDAFPDLERLYQCCERNHLLLIFKMHPWMEDELDYLNAKEIYGNRPYFWFWDNRNDFYEIIDQIDLAIIDYSSILSDFVAAGVPHYIRYIYDFDQYIVENMIQEGEYFDRTIGFISRSFDELLSGMDSYQRRDDTLEFQRIHEKMWAYAGGKSDFEKTISRVMDFKVKPRKFKTLYSFDIFDTLISRKVLDPIGIFALVKDRMDEYGGFPKALVKKYPQIRYSSEQNVREFYQKSTNLRDSERVEITFKEIFDHIADVYDLSEEQITLLSQWELEEEMNNVIPLDEQINLVKQLVAQDETVVLICDMYLPKEVIQEMLHRADPVLAELPLFLSSEYGVQKTNQKLFFKVYESFEPFYDFKKWIHYGDTPNVDIKPARKFKICTRQILKPEFNKIQQQMVKYLDSGDGYLVAALQARMCAEALLKKDEFVISYIALTMVPYVDWVLRDAISRGYDMLYFVSRDGYHLKRIADEIIRIRGLDIKTKYIYASRRTWRIPSYIDKVDEDFWLGHGNLANITSKEKLLKALDLDENTFRRFFPTIDLDIIDFNDKEAFNGIREMIHASESYNAYLLKTAAEERPLVEDYLKQEICFDESFAFVEYYGRGYNQDCLVRLLEDINGEEMEVPCYYMRTILPTMGNAIRHHFSTYEITPYFMESIFANMPYKSIEEYKRQPDGTIEPVITSIDYDIELFNSMKRILPEFAAKYAEIELRYPEGTDRLLNEFAFNYFEENSDDMFMAENIGGLRDSVSLYGKKREFAPPYTEENLEQFANKEVNRDSFRLTNNVPMSVARSSDEIRKKYFELYQILPGDDVNSGKVLPEEDLEVNRDFRQKYEDLQSEAKIYQEAYEQAILKYSVQQKVVFVATGKTLKNTGLDLVNKLLKEQGCLESTTVSMKEWGDFPEKIVAELASARFILISRPIAQFCKITFRSETTEIMLNNIAFPLYNKSLSANYYLKWHTNYERLAGKNDISVLQIPSERLKERFIRNYSRKSATDYSLHGCCNTDIYYDENAKIEALYKLQDVFPESVGKELILYMPKVRSRSNCEEWISMLDLEVLYELLGDEYAIVVNFNNHQLKNKYYNVIEIAGFSKIINNEISLRELMIASDVIVGDYRDTFFESAILHKPVYFTTADYEQVIKAHNMDVANEFESYIFGPVVATSFDLVDELKESEDYDYSKMEKFRDEMFEYCDGHSVERVINYLITKS